MEVKKQFPSRKSRRIKTRKNEVTRYAGKEFVSTTFSPDSKSLVLKKINAACFRFWF
jgi:predicted metalloendopeptidase